VPKIRGEKLPGAMMSISGRLAQDPKLAFAEKRPCVFARDSVVFVRRKPNYETTRGAPLLKEYYDNQGMIFAPGLK
jgi:hypothetical protein